MKKNIIKICLLTVFLIIISNIVILIMGRTYTASFMIKDNMDYKLSVENNNDYIEIIEEKKTSDRYFVKVRAKKEGSCYLNLTNMSLSESKNLYVHKSLIITENSYFGRSTGSEIIPISVIIIILYILTLLIKHYRNCIKENIYQYKNIAFLGIIIFLFLFILKLFNSLFHYRGVIGTVEDIIGSSLSASVYLFPIALFTFIFVVINNITLIIKEGISFRNFLGLLFSIFLCFTIFIPDTLYNFLMTSQIVDIFNLNGPGPYIYNFVETLIYLSISYLECILLGTIIIAIKSVRKKPEYNKDYMIILGCKVRKDGKLTPLLKGRVDRAIRFRNEQLKETGKDLIFIPSGGKGEDETISEAEAMKNYLLEQGIKEKNIITENKSKNTYENIKYSSKLIKNKKSNICFSTTNYHVLRAGLIATEQNIKIDGIGSKTKVYFWLNAFIREFIGTLHSERKKHILVIILIIINIIMMIGITYMANNI